MELYLVQHGEAKSEAEDPQRLLTDRGRMEVKRVAEFARRSGAQPVEIRHSGKKRAEKAFRRESGEERMNHQVINRRELLRFCGSAGLLLLCGKSLPAKETLIPAAAAVDHLLLGVADLNEGIRWVEEKTGVKAALGGVHPGMGTRNALLSLGGKRYLEIIGPDPQQTVYNFALDVRTLSEPRLITWAAASTDIDALAKKAGEAGLQAAGPYDGSRNKPDGTTLRWRILFIPAEFAIKPVDVLPFFIKWRSDSVHPSEDSPKGCELQSLAIEHPKSELLTVTLEKLGIEAKVKQAQNARLIAIIKTPKGQVELN